MNEQKRVTCFWCEKKYFDLVKHTLHKHKGLAPRSYDLIKICKPFYSKMHGITQCSQCGYEVFRTYNDCPNCHTTLDWRP